MGISHYPNGWPNGVVVRGNPIEIRQGGDSKVFWVDSGLGSNGNKGTFNSPFATIDYAIGQCAANRGDIIYVAPGHIETVSSAGGLAFDVEGITVYFLGEGDERATIKFSTLVGASMTVTADNTTLVTPRFLAAIDALTGPIAVSADYFTMIDYKYYDALNIDTTDCITFSSGSDYIYLSGQYIPSTEAGTQKQSHIRFDGTSYKSRLENLDIRGDFAAYPIEMVAGIISDLYMNNITIDSRNAGPIPGLGTASGSTGWAKNILIRVASGTTYVSALDCTNWDNNCYGYNSWGAAGDPIATAAATGLEGKIDIIDAYHDVPTADAVSNSQMRDVVGNKTDAAASGAVSTTESLMAYAKQTVTEGIARDTAIGVIDGFHDVPTADVVTNAQMRDVVGNKADAAAVGAVTATESLMAYAKQNVTNIGDPSGDTLTSLTAKLGNGATTVTADLATIDGYHDVPTADVITNAQMRDVIGNKADAAAVGAVSATESLMAYAKQNVTNIGDPSGDTLTTITAKLGNSATTVAADLSTLKTNLGDAGVDTFTSVIDKLGDNQTRFSDLIGLADGATTESLHGKLGTDTELADRSVYDILNGGGPAAAASAAAPGNNVSLYGVVRDSWDVLRNGTGGSEPDTNKSIIDAIGSNGTTLSYGSGSMLGAIGTVFWLKKTVTSSTITFGAAVDITGVSSGGELAIEDVIVKTDATGLANGTNFELKSNNTDGLANIFVDTVANLGASKTIDLDGASITGIRSVLESGAKLQVQSTVADCTGAGTITIYVKLRRLSAGATVAAV